MQFLQETVITRLEHLLKLQQQLFKQAAQKRLGDNVTGLVLSLVAAMHRAHVFTPAIRTLLKKLIRTATEPSAVLQFNFKGTLQCTFALPK